MAVGEIHFHKVEPGVAFRRSRGRQPFEEAAGLGVVPLDIGDISAVEAGVFAEKTVVAYGFE